MSLQKFKLNDALEQKVIDTTLPTLTLLGNERDAFYAGAYTAEDLGGVLYDLQASPLAKVLLRENFVKGFDAIHTLFTRPGTFEYYLDVFRRVFPGATVTFTVPAPGKLEINIASLSIQEVQAILRQIVDDAYVYNDWLETFTGDNIMFQLAQGIRTQRETDALIFELSPAGIFVTATLTIV